VGKPYDLTLSVLTTGGSGTGYKFTIKGKLPFGVKFSSTKGSISGTPTSAGTYPINIKVTDSLQGTFTKEVIMVISSE
jgi:hypothetical protein